MPDITEADVAVMRKQGDLPAFIKQAVAAAAAECAARVKLINRHPDLAAQVADVLGHDRWNGYVAPEYDCTGRINTSPYRRRLVTILAEAEQRAGQQQAAA